MSKFILLKEKYECALELQNKQMTLNLSSEEAAAFDDFMHLEKQIQSVFNEVQALDLSVENDVSSSEREELALIVEKLISNNNIIKNKVEQLYSSTSVTMNQVSRHKKTLTSYGGVNQFDEIAYYFDEKR